MKPKVFIVMKEDIISYPPALSIIRALVDLNYDIFHIGRYSDSIQKLSLESKGVKFYETDKYESSNYLIKLCKQLKFKNKVLNILKKEKCSKTDYVWLLNAETICLLGNSLVKKYKTIFHYFEFTMPYINWHYFLFSLISSYNPYKANKRAYKVVQCEYNRAHIFKGILHLEKLPVILPNKPYHWDHGAQELPADIVSIISDIKKKTDNKYVVLYQGAFQGKDRRLDEFFESIDLLPENYVLLAMGPTSEEYYRLKDKYESSKVIFIPFIRPPYHLEVTKLSHIGILSYVANGDGVAGVINPIYCAPNKIFEYSKYGIPMISNDLPGLTNIYSQYNCGKAIKYPILAENIKEAILDISRNHEYYSSGSKSFYKTIDFKEIVAGILSNR